MNSMLRGTHVAHDDRDCVMRNMSAICIPRGQGVQCRLTTVLSYTWCRCYKLLCTYVRTYEPNTHLVMYEYTYVSVCLHIYVAMYVRMYLLTYLHT